MKRALVMLLGGIVMVFVVLSGYSKSDAASSKPIRLVYSDFRTGEAFTVKGMVVPWAKDIETKTNGRVKIEMYPNGTLGAAEDHYDMVVHGVCDIAGPMIEYTPGRFPIFEINKLPMLFPSAEVAGAVLNEIAQKYCVGTELKDVKVLWVESTTPLQLQLKKRPVQTMEDLKNLKINCEGRIVAQTLKALGAVPVNMATPEIYSSLERGVIDGTVFGWEGTIAFKIQDVTKYRTECDLCVMAWPIIMNLAKWNSLPADIQKVFEDLSGTKRARMAGAAFDATDKYIKQAIMGIDAKVGNPKPTVLSDDERARWLETVKPIWYQWAKEKDAEGLHGTKVLEETIQLIERYASDRS